MRKIFIHFKALSSQVDSPFVFQIADTFLIASHPSKFIFFSCYFTEHHHSNGGPTPVTLFPNLRYLPYRQHERAFAQSSHSARLLRTCFLETRVMSPQNISGAIITGLITWLQTQAMSTDPAFAASIHHLYVPIRFSFLFKTEKDSTRTVAKQYATASWGAPYTSHSSKYFSSKFFAVLALASLTGLTLSLRVYALYGRDWKVFLLLVPTFVVEMVIEAWAVAGGVPVPIPPGQVGCILTGKPNQGDRFAAFWIGQLIFPSVIFLLTTGRVLVMKQQGTIKGGITMLLLRDGVMYFAMIFTVNLANVLTYVIAPPDIQAINAPFSALITAMMICRLMLNLRSVGTSNIENNPYIRTRTGNIISETLVGNLGEALDVAGDWKEPKDDHMRHEFSSSQVYELDTISR
ncbi:uncharacterized protein FOMMEDRAFT_159982 [Fomitiporia mediterranea MF3/22]|uniref:uncharacterized protein n=1 Tax=Fomitiporia mediterranea (strain MF3/22) TaxID=694068 RepID=UPI00044092F0|nr:uncharacterized protein FOMMEDRAFT_159982 [Fomitiporia mediterranea MF3/22]EJC99568.1 hypothetical protein FOMMEDRAFT_159982 [Fomitiporia mediterranea MF3/22]